MARAILDAEMARLPAVAVSLDGARAVLVDHLEGHRYPATVIGRDGFFQDLVVQLTPRSEPTYARVLASNFLRIAWDHEAQQVRWPLPFDEAFPGLTLVGVGEFLDNHDLAAGTSRSRYAFEAELWDGTFDVLQRRPASGDSILRFLKGKVYWTWRFRLPDTHIALPDATRLGISVQALLHSGFPYEGQWWTRSGRSLVPTPQFIRMFEGQVAAEGAPPPEGQPDLVYDVALSFAGEQREYVQQVADLLVAANVRVFYDRFEDLWGVDLTRRLEDVYRRRSGYVVVFVSREYIDKAWPNLERQHALAGRIERRDDSVLPARFEPLELPGLPATVGYLDISQMSPGDLASRILRKVR